MTGERPAAAVHPAAKAPGRVVDLAAPCLELLVALCAALNLVGWAFARGVILGIAPFWVPMAPATAMTFFAVAVVLVIHRAARSPASGRLLAACLIAVAVASAVVGFTRVAAVAWNAPVDIEHPLIAATESAYGFVVGRMSPLTALLFVLVTLAALAGRRPATLAGAAVRVPDGLALAALAISSVILVGYLYDAPLLYGGSVIPVALSTAVLFWILAHGLLFERGMFLHRLVTSESLFARIVRVAIPASAGIMVIAGWISLKLLTGASRSSYVLFFSLGALVTASLITSVTVFVVRRVTGAVDRAERAVQDAQVRFRETLDAMLEGCQILDHEWRYVYVNRAAAAHGRRSCDELLGRMITDAYPGIESTPMFEALRRCMEERQPALLENRFVYPDGTEAWFELSIQPSPEGVFVLSLDITERKRQEEELRAHRDDLERLVTARTAALEREVQERRLAEEHARQWAAEVEVLNHELEAFSYSVSHDLRAPLRAIDGFSQALVEDCGPVLDEVGRSHLERIRANAQRMAELIDDLLTLSRLSRSELVREPVDLTQLANEVVSGFRAAEPDRQISVRVAEGLRTIGDQRLLRTLLENLLGNAWKFTRRTHHARIEVGASGDADGGWFFVRDNGAGFDMAFADKLFGAFQRLHSVREFEGHGIGLATVQRIINRHGGRIRGLGAVGEGATFYFSLDEPGPPVDERSG